MGVQNDLGRAHRLVTVVFHVLRERLEFGFFEQLTERALAVPVRGEVVAVVLAQVLDFGGGMLVVDLPALLWARPSRPGFFGALLMANFSF